MRTLMLLSGVVVAGTAFAAPHVVMVVPFPDPAKAGDSVDLEAKIGHSAEVVLISPRAQLEAADGARLGAPPGGPGSTELLDSRKWAAADALQIAHFTGADAVVHGPMGGWQLCMAASNDCKPIAAKDAAAAADEVLKAVGAAPVKAGTSWPDETAKPAARTAYGKCRRTLSALLQRTAKKGKKALKTIDKDCSAAMAADPKYLPAKAAHAAALALAGDAKAQAALKDALKALPGDSLAPAGLTEFKRTHPDTDVTGMFSEANAAAPNSLDVLQELGEMDVASDDRDGAVKAFEKAVALVPNSAYLHARLASSAYVAEDVKKAAEHAKKASELAHGEHDQFQAEYASRLIDANKFKEAQAVLEPLRKADPTWGRVALRLGFALHKQGKSKEALPHFEAALTSDPRPGREQYDREMAELDVARVHAVLGDKEAALKTLNSLQAKGKLEPITLKDPDFNSLRSDPTFKKLAGD